MAYGALPRSIFVPLERARGFQLQVSLHFDLSRLRCHATQTATNAPAVARRPLPPAIAIGLSPDRLFAVVFATHAPGRGEAGRRALALGLFESG
jgi:hypothetical protein